MGLLDKLIGGIKSEIGSEIRAGIRDALNMRPSSAPSAAPQSTSPAGAAASFDDDSFGRIYNTGDDHFAAIITESQFPGYTIEKGVHPSVFDASAHPSCFPISYLFRKDGVPVLAVLVMNRNQYRAMIAVGTYTVLDDRNIKYIRFYKGMENAESYVLNRIKENL